MVISFIPLAKAERQWGRNKSAPLLYGFSGQSDKTIFLLYARCRHKKTFG